MRFRDEVKTLKPYYIDEKSVKFKMDANESPFDLDGDERALLLKELSQIEINRYPDPSLKRLRTLIAEEEGLTPDQILFGNGSDEIIYLLLMCLEEGAKVAFPEPGFAMYSIGAKIFGKRLIPFKLHPPHFTVDGEEFLKLLREEGPELVFIGNPNNPTGNLFPAELLEVALRDHRETLFVSDEAYFHYAESTMLPYVEKCPNLLVMRSFSKIGFASIRLGYLVGKAELIREIGKVRLPYNVNSFTQKVAEIFFQRKDLIKRQVSVIIEERERLYDILTKLNIFTLPSKANFVTFKIEKGGFYEYLLDHGLLIKDLYPSFGIKGFFRLTVGKREENDYFIKLLTKFIEGGPNAG